MNNIFDSFSSFGSLNSIDLSKILKLNDITPEIQNHLAKVYSALIACVISACIGVGFNIYTGFGGVFAFFGVLGMLYWLQIDQRKTEWQRRLIMLCTLGFLQGTSVGPLFDMVIQIDPSIVVTALLGTTAVFTCFSLAAILAKRRSYLYIGGFLSSAISLLALFSFINIFVHSVQIFNAHLYGGLLIFTGFVIFDTQMIIEKAHLGSRDFAGHAAELFVDFVAIIVRLTIILLKNSRRSNEDDTRRRNKRRY